MSGNDPFDPFKQNERTIIRPNPGGRAPQAPQQPAQPQHPGQQYQPQQPTPQQPAPPPQAQQPAGGYQPPNAQAIPLSTPGANPLLSAAGPLLDLLARLRNAMTMASFAARKALHRSARVRPAGSSLALGSRPAYKSSLTRWYSSRASFHPSPSIRSNWPLTRLPHGPR